jgi:hypothetical protein
MIRSPTLQPYNPTLEFVEQIGWAQKSRALDVRRVLQCCKARWTLAMQRNVHQEHHNPPPQHYLSTPTAETAKLSTMDGFSTKKSSPHACHRIREDNSRSFRGNKQDEVPDYRFVPSFGKWVHSTHVPCPCMMEPTCNAMWSRNASWERESLQ